MLVSLIVSWGRLGGGSKWGVYADYGRRAAVSRHARGRVDSGRGVGQG